MRKFPINQNVRRPRRCPYCVQAINDKSAEADPIPLDLTMVETMPSTDPLATLFSITNNERFDIGKPSIFCYINVGLGINNNNIHDFAADVYQPPGPLRAC
jgi:hypothetical protein